jgi:hypothetical protein
VIRPLGDDDWRAPGFQRSQHVVEDQLVAPLVAGERSIDVLDRNRRRVRFAVWQAKRRLPNADTVIERPPSRLRPRIDALLAHLSPMGWAHVSLTGDYLWTDAAAAGCFRPLNDPADRLYRAA